MKEKEVPQEHFNKPSLARVAERCFKSSVKFNPEGKEGGVLRFQTNSMSFYQKMNIRQNSIEGNLLRQGQEAWERKRSKKLRVLKWDSMELRHDMGKYHEHIRGKIKRRKKEKERRREQRLIDRQCSILTDISANPEQQQSDDIIKEDPPPKIRAQSATPVSRPSSHRFRMRPQVMDELGLAGVEVPNIEISWGKVSRTVLNLHKTWNNEKNQRNIKSGKSDPGRLTKSDILEPPLLESEDSEDRQLTTPDDRGRTATRSHQSYMHTCLAKPFSYEDFADKKISCKENEQYWITSLRDPHPRKYNRFTTSGEEQSITQRQFSERNLEKAKKVREEGPPELTGTNVNERITRMKFTSSKMLEERAELDRKAEEDRIATDKFIRRHKYLDKNITVDNISRERPAYLRYRYAEPSERKVSFSSIVFP